MNPHSSRTPEEIAAAAAAWLARRDRGLTANEQDVFLHWLAEDARHRTAFGALERDWAGLDLLAHWRPRHSAQPNPDLLARPHRLPAAGWRRVRNGLVAAVAALVLSAGWLTWRAAAPADARFTRLNAIPGATVVRDSAQKILEDGSVLDLNHGAAVEVRFTADERAVWLVQGEVHFTVSKNPTRPFVVRAGKVAIRAVGTAFNVRLEPHAVEVLVTEGRVRVTPPANSPAAETGVPELGAGQRATVPDDGVARVDSVSADGMAQALAWQPRQLEFDSARLTDVVAAFNRHNRVQLVIADPALAEVSIGASFRSNNVEGFVRLLEASFDIAAVHERDRIELRRARFP